MLFPKPKTDRDEKYLAYLRTLPCLLKAGCFGPIQAHHTTRGGIGLKGSDYEAVPVCMKCHKLIHDKGAGIWKTKRIDLEKEIRILNAKYEAHAGAR